MSVRLRIFVTHPVQYHVPLWRALSEHPELDVSVFYFSDQGLRGGLDKGFGVPVAWDVDLQSGYRSTFLSREADLERPRSIKIPDPETLLAAERPDWVWLSGYTHTFERQLVRASRRHGYKVLMRGEFSDLSDLPRPLAKRAARAVYLRWFYRQAHRFCAPGVMARRHLLGLGVSPKQISLSPYSVDDRLIEQQRRLVTRTNARAALGISEQSFMFLFSGKLIPRKDPLGLLDAIARMPNRERVGLIALGDGELRQAFESRGRELLGERFIFPGFVNQSELGRFFVAADALVMPSRFETWGLVVNEAMHHGLPVITSDRVGCHADLIQEGETGFTYSFGKAGELAERMWKLSQDAQRAGEMGQAARKLAQRYTVAASAQGVFEALGVSPINRE